MRLFSNLTSYIKKRLKNKSLHIDTIIDNNTQTESKKHLHVRDMDDNYILPNLFVSNSFQELENIKQPNILLPIGYKPKNYKSISFTELVDKKKQTFIIGEPGCGKSRLLYEVKRNAEKLNKKYFFISLKDLGENESIIEHFDLNIIEGSDNNIICLDALDEVNPYLFSKVVSKILDLKNIMNNSSILISCRMHYITKNQYICELTVKQLLIKK